MAARVTGLRVVAGGAETVGAVFERETIVRLLFAPAIGDEGLKRPAAPGDLYIGRVRTIAPALKAAFVDIGEAREALAPTPAGKAAPLVGAGLVFRVRRAALGDKGAVIEATGEPAPKDARPGRRETGEGAIALIEAQAKALGFDLVADAATPAIAASIDLAIGTALERTAPLPGGGRLVIDETEGGAVIDVDLGEGAAARGRAVNDRMNDAAATALFGELSRRAIGGRIVVDFLPPSSAEARAALFERLKRAAPFYQRRLGRLAADGFLDMTAPRFGESLLGYATEQAGPDFIRPGRRHKLDFAAKRAIRALERRLETAPSRRLALIASTELADYLAANRRWLERVAEKHGARFDLRPDPTRPERNYDVAE
jgi:Ribonuclease G/E